MKLILFISVALISISSIFGQEPILKNELDSLSYSLGYSIGRDLQKSNINEINAAVFAKSLSDYLNNENFEMSVSEIDNFLRQYFTDLKMKIAQINLEKGMKFMEENLKNEGITELESGLQYKILQEGEGVSPNATNKVVCHYRGTLIDGTVFDSSYDRGQPVEFPVNGIIQGWTEALQLMKAGSKWMLYIPPNLAYGERGAGNNIGPNESLIFEVELIEIK
ncbi:FKBP-type peptidyl-prolyl cis-trans isomerase [Bacteroidota bacterium]